jgi:hypothetical protein
MSYSANCCNTRGSCFAAVRLMNAHITPAVSSAIRRLAEMAALEPADSAAGQVARATGALPVHVDMGGAFVLTTDGTVLGYDYETELTTDPPGEWVTLALAKAARKFVELQSLASSVPSDAVQCPVCSGSGQVFGWDCGKCSSTGWISVERNDNGFSK